MKSRHFMLNALNGVYKRSRSLFKNPYEKVGFNWFTVRVVKNLPQNKLHVVSLFGKPISFFSRDEFLHSLREIFIEEIYKQRLRSGPYIIDCGANIGLSVIYLKRLFPDAKVVAFEPDDANFNLLKKNTIAFGLENVELHKEAVWVENTTIRFANEGSLMSRIDENQTSKHPIQVKGVRLKDFLQQPVDFLKIDIEGAEYKVLKDIAGELAQIYHLFIEYHGTFEQNSELNEMLNMISASGFKYYIKEAADKHPHPFSRQKTLDYDVQLNIFCFRDQAVEF